MYTNMYIPLQDPPKFTPIWIFGLKIYHLATLLGMQFKYKTANIGIPV
jgi:hypothetical protein